MKRLLTGFLSLLCMPTLILAERVTVDKTLAVVYHPEGVKHILASDLKPKFGGAPRDLQQVIFDTLVVFDGQKLKIPVTDAELEPHLMRLKKSQNFSDAELADFFEENGFTVQEGREELRKVLIIEQMLDYRVRSKASMSKVELEKYMEKNPLYVFQQAFIPFDIYKQRVSQEQAIDAGIKSGSLSDTASWQEPFELLETDIAPEKSFIKDISFGTIVKMSQDEKGTHILRRLAPGGERLKQRETEVMNILGQERLMAALEEYRQKLFAAPTRIEYLDENFKPIA